MDPSVSDPATQVDHKSFHPDHSLLVEISVCIYLRQFADLFDLVAGVKSRVQSEENHISSLSQVS